MEHSDYEEIRNLKARYFRYLDTRRWQDLRGLLTDDFTGDFGASDEEQFASPEAFIEGLQRNLKDATTVHHGHMPEIEVQNADQASALSPHPTQAGCKATIEENISGTLDQLVSRANRW